MRKDTDVFNALIKSRESVEQQGLKRVNQQLEVANGQIGSVEQTISSVMDTVGAWLGRIARASTTLS